MKKIAFLCCLFFLAVTAYADDFSLSGYLKNEFSMGMDTFNDVHKFKNILGLSGEYRINDDWTLFASTRYWYDAVYDWYEKYDPAQHYMGHVQRTDWLRDCYLDYISDNLDIRLGKQQVVWGQSDGIPILDRVNPFDLTEYWLPDFVDLRIPLWMINIKYAPKINSVLQLLIIPDFEQSTSAPPAAPLSFRSYQLFQAFKDWWEGPPTAIPFKPFSGTVNANIYYPAKKFKNSTFGVQWLDRIGELEYTLNFLYGYYYSARTYFEGAGGMGTILNYGRRFKLWRMYGGSFNRTFTEAGPLQGITLRGDFAYYNDEPVTYGNPDTGSSGGVHRWDNIFWLIGIDKYVATNWLVSFQFSQYIMQEAKPGGVDPNTGTPYVTFNAYTYGPQDQVENIFSLKIMTDFMHERLKSEILWSWTDDNQGRVSPKINYEIKDNLWLTTGIHYFYGNEYDTNGQFRDKSQVYLNITYTF